MKAIIQAYSPEEVERIARGEQTIKVCKTAPKDTPFKVYMYMTHKGNKFIQKMKTTKGYDAYVEVNYKITGKVVGEYVCDKVDRFLCTSVPYQKHNNLGYGHFLDNGVYKIDGLEEAMVCERNDLYIDSMLNNNDLKEMCLSAQELFNYVGIYKHFNTLHITAVKFYDKPKELSEFKKYNRTCKFSDLGYAIPNCKTCRDCNLTRPPQSWQYVIGDR